MTDRDDQRLAREKARHEMAMQRLLAGFVCSWLLGSSVACLSLFFLQGFKPMGFHLDPALMQWIGGATIGEFGMLAPIVYRGFFRSPVRNSPAAIGNFLSLGPTGSAKTPS